MKVGVIIVRVELMVKKVGKVMKMVDYEIERRCRCRWGSVGLVRDGLLSKALLGEFAVGETEWLRKIVCRVKGEPTEV
jgi:hypothetical protein